MEVRGGLSFRGLFSFSLALFLSMDSIEFQTLRDLQTFNIKQINQLCRRYNTTRIVHNRA